MFVWDKRSLEGKSGAGGGEVKAPCAPAFLLGILPLTLLILSWRQSQRHFGRPLKIKQTQSNVWGDIIPSLLEHGDD